MVSCCWVDSDDEMDMERPSLGADISGPLARVAFVLGDERGEGEHPSTSTVRGDFLSSSSSRRDASPTEGPVDGSTAPL